jgi:pyruvate dehydrogenase E2 component (dihydrolipoyllysine-residue acetyltransferase)
MPKLSDSMTEGTIVAWLKSSGERVARGEEIVEIETDKAIIAYAVEAEGVLEILEPVGATLPLGTAIARIGVQVEGASPPDPILSTTAVRAQSTPPDARASNVSPVARRRAEQLGVDLSLVIGTGPAGRIVKADVDAKVDPDAALTDASDRARSTVELSPGDTEKGMLTVRTLSSIQRTIVRKMSEAHMAIPDFAVSIDVDMDVATDLRAHLKATAPPSSPAPSLNDMVVKATALALRDHPRLNASYGNLTIEMYERINIGLAVATHDALVVPTIHDADRLSLRDLSEQSRTLAARARAGEIMPQDLSGGTFTVSNLGMYGVTAFIAVINTPQTAILAVGAVRDEAVVSRGRIAPGKRLTLTLSCDHRLVYGAEAAQFLARIKALLQAPQLLVP